MKADELPSISLFAELTDAQRAAIAARLQEVDVDLGTVLARQGEFAYDLFVVLDGVAAVSLGDHLVATLHPGDCFGEVGVLQKGRRTANVVAVTPMRLLEMVVWDFSDVTREIPELAERVQRLAQQRLEHA